MLVPTKIEPTALRVLLIQDDPGLAASVCDALHNSQRGEFEVEWLRTCTEGLQRLAELPTHEVPGVAAVLVDLNLPDCQGVETFDRIFKAAPQTPILILCAPDQEDAARTAVERGAQDYLLNSRLDDYQLPKALRSMIERAANAEALFEEKERAQVTLNSIGDAVISCDVQGNVTYLNVVAADLTGWPCEEALGHSIDEVFRPLDALTRRPAVNPMAKAIRQNATVSLSPNCLLIRRDGTETAIEDSAAPIHDRRGRVTGAVIVFRDVSVARAASMRMSHLAQHDSLTDLPNRALMDDRLDCAISLAHRHRQKLALLFLDVDRFKHLNDTLGHDIGDRLLQAVSQRLLGAVRSSDTVSRQGGDEFVLLLSEVRGADSVAACAEKILKALGAPYQLDQHTLHLTASLGIAVYPDDGTDAPTLRKHADLAMYHAKQLGRNNYQFFEPGMNRRALERQEIERGLRVALEREQFELHYQPMIDLRTQAITGLEALVRWRHPSRGLLEAAQFVPVARDSGLIIPIGRWVLTEACRQARSWQEAGILPKRIAINISATELREQDFVAGVIATLRQAGLPAGNVEFELTESFLTHEALSAAAVLGSVRDLGAQIALDNFGTGISRLAQLKHFPIDTLKIDQSFLHAATTDAGAAGIVGAIVSFARGLGLRVTAEGIETREQLAFLLEVKCSEGQGNFLARPQAARAITRVLQRGLSPAGVQRRRTVRSHETMAVGESSA